MENEHGSEIFTNPQYIINAPEKVSAKLAKLGQGSSVRP